jgi:hypothetical protein
MSWSRFGEKIYLRELGEASALEAYGLGPIEILQHINITAQELRDGKYR